METLGDNLGAKRAEKGHCELCDFKCFKKYDWDRHLLTRKHIQMTQSEQTVTEKGQKGQKGQIKEKNIECQYCGKQYTSRNGLWKHSKVCSENQDNKSTANIPTDMILEIVKQNNDFQKLVMEQNQKIMEQHQMIIELANKTSIANSNNTTNNTTNCNNTTNKNKFNLNFFLNEQCKDALNITDFVNSLQVQMADLENTGKLGFSEGISQIFIRGLKELDVYKRPIHCSDLKRETMYVKDQNIWEKEDDEKERIKKTINKIAHKNIKQIPSWMELHPKCTESTSVYNDLYLNIVNESMGGEDEAETNKYYEKIVKNVSREVTI